MKTTLPPKRTSKNMEWKVSLSASGLSYLVTSGNKCLMSSSWSATSPYYPTKEETKVNITLAAAAPDLLKTQTMGQSLNTPDFLDWHADRLVNVYGENPNTDFVLSLRERAAAGRAAIAKAEGRS